MLKVSYIRVTLSGFEIIHLKKVRLDNKREFEMYIIPIWNFTKLGHQCPKTHLNIFMYLIYYLFGHRLQSTS